MFLSSAVTFSTLVPGASSISYRVTVGPRENPETSALTLNCSNTSPSAATTWSLTSERVLWGGASSRYEGGGSVQTMSPASASASQGRGSARIGAAPGSS